MTAITTTLLPQIGKAKAGHVASHAAKAGASADMPDFLSLGAIEAPEVAGQIATSPAGKTVAKTPVLAVAAAEVTDAAIPDLPGDLPLIGERHQSAEHGKDLPQGEAETETSDDTSPEAHMEAAIAWLMPAPVAETVVAKTDFTPVTRAAPKIAAVADQAPVAALPSTKNPEVPQRVKQQPVVAQPQATPVVPQSTPIAQAQPQPGGAPQTVSSPAPAQQAPAQPFVILQQQAATTAPVISPIATPVAPAEPRLRAASTAAPVQPLAASPAQAITPAATPALAQLTTRMPERASEAVSQRRRVTEATTGADLRAAAPVEAPAIAVTQTTDAQNGTLDMTRQDWPSKMVDHIEKLRDDANAADTRIRLVPDQLGQVDVSIRQDGDTLHVHFATETQDAANLIQDAQPVLADLAESRGLRLGQSSVDTGNAQGFADRQNSNQAQSQSQAQSQAQAQPNHNRSTRLAPAPADNDDLNSPDTRIA